ncbi:hypothetical protein N7509_006713 [Penicillium cosmopolitanum]|uniref:Uncharacterized protein n=1 Tax=Penicillium cosmopolitanum TaxID=1131564 RepID=A0A9X0B7T1_9EURO|nr:uncharacterized protein N7509_006713 [Penicillium cosmopolitanum]KAJ5391223.1 hypothetical protein N7509_006713 [Penicillium cosmopolitanum]
MLLGTKGQRFQTTLGIFEVQPEGSGKLDEANDYCKAKSTSDKEDANINAGPPQNTRSQGYRRQLQIEGKGVR